MVVAIYVPWANGLHFPLPRCVQHPYLNAPELQSRNAPPAEMHKSLIDASAKLSWLKLALPKLFERGHRVLLFSQVSK